jgi:hypothetical protein
MFKKALVLPVAFGAIFATMSTAQARPLQPGLFLTGQNEAQVQVIVAETRREYPTAEVIVTYDIGFRSYTVEVKPNSATQESGGADGNGGGDGGGAE